MKVVKFGGTSLANAAQIRKVIDIVRSDPERRVVVVSAPGKRAKDDVKVTDMLIALADKCLARGDAAREMAAIVARFAEIQRELGLPADIVREIEKDLRERMAGDRERRESFTDCLKAAGEDNNAKLVAAAFRGQGMDASYVSPKDAGLLLSPEPGNALVLDESYPNLQRALKTKKGIVIFPGFFGYTSSGDVVTFPRGGSDITGAILAAAIKADVYENFTDVDSVYAIDPTLVDGAPSINLLTFREMRELAYAGFGVFHDEAVMPAVKASVPICIKNTNNPAAPGTMIVPQRKYKSGEVVGVASADGFCAIYIDKYLLNREIGFGLRVLKIMVDERISYEHMPSGIDNVSIILRDKQFTPDKEARVVARIKSELQPDNILVERGLALVMVVGEGMHYTVGMAGRAATALSESGVNIEMINQGASEISMMFGVKSTDRIKAVRALYKEFFARRIP